MAPQVFEAGQGDVLNVNLGEITCDDYIFISWNTEPDRSGTEYPQGIYFTPSDSDQTLYAQWYIDYDIGDIGPAGGLIFYKKTDETDDFIYPEWMYLEAAQPDWGEWSGVQWAPQTPAVPGTLEAQGAGTDNTSLIVQAFIWEGDLAAHLCGNLSQAGYSDWFLPSWLELRSMFLNLHRAGLGGFENYTLYWSSTEAGSPNTSEAMYLVLNSGIASPAPQLLSKANSF